jgi:2-amino-4-hydroxy-6-hydroxymethyldihydropteridine diphosphokinase
MPEVYVAAGSNIAPGRHLGCAVAELTREFADVRFSPWYRNRPAAASAGAAGAVGAPGTAGEESAVCSEGIDFVNLVAGFTTALSVREVQARLRAIEDRCGRARRVQAQLPPVLDLDLLLYGDLVSAEPGLNVPRPELLTRAYMLGPLAALAPQVMHPTAHLSIGELWQRFDRAAHPLERLPS